MNAAAGRGARPCRHHDRTRRRANRRRRRADRRQFQRQSGQHGGGARQPEGAAGPRRPAHRRARRHAGARRRAGLSQGSPRTLDRRRLLRRAVDAPPACCCRRASADATRRRKSPGCRAGDVVVVKGSKKMFWVNSSRGWCRSPNADPRRRILTGRRAVCGCGPSGPIVSALRRHQGSSEPAIDVVDSAFPAKPRYAAA